MLSKSAIKRFKSSGVRISPKGLVELAIKINATTKEEIIHNEYEYWDIADIVNNACEILDNIRYAQIKDKKTVSKLFRNETEKELKIEWYKVLYKLCSKEFPIMKLNDNFVTLLLPNETLITIPNMYIEDYIRYGEHSLRGV